MAFIKMLHVLFVFVWVGNLLSLTRLLGYHARLDEGTQLKMTSIYHRMYRFVGLPSLLLAVLFGAALMIRLDPERGLLWFITKMVFAVGLILCDLICGDFIVNLVGHLDHSNGKKYKILHGICGLLLIGVLASIYLLKL
jgi:uncharacterized membrane protein